MEIVIGQPKKYTLEEVKADLASGKSKMIYYSSGSLWWTHLEEDIIAATKIGEQAQDDRNAQMLADPNRSEADKKKLASLMTLIKNGRAEREKTLIEAGMKKEDIIGMPCDPQGAPLFQTDRPLEWIAGAEEKPDHFGKLGLEAFMRAHHKNCKGRCYAKWDAYNIVLLNEN